MNNQLVEVIQDLDGGGRILPFLGQLTENQRWQIWNYMREQGEQLSSMSAWEVIGGALGGTIGLLATNSLQGTIAGAHAGTALARNPTFSGRISGPSQNNLPSSTTMPGEQEKLIAPPGASSASRIAASSKASATNGTMVGVGHGETPVDPYKYVSKTPWPRTVTVLHDYYNFQSAQTVTPQTASTRCVTRSYRLNSIYDIRDDATYSSAEVGYAAADAKDADGLVDVPTWRNHYAGYYKYWTVLKSQYRLRFFVEPEDNTAKNDSRTIELMVYVYHHGAQKPPKIADADNLEFDHQFRRNHQGMYYFPIRYKPRDAGTTIQEAMDFNSCSGEWYPGSIRHEVAEDELQQIWHKVTEVPPTREGLTIHIQPSPTNTYNANITVRTEVSFKYVTQWKDLLQQYQYMTPGVDQQTTANTGAQAVI